MQNHAILAPVRIANIPGTILEYSAVSRTARNQTLDEVDSQRVGLLNDFSKSFVLPQDCGMLLQQSIDEILEKSRHIVRVAVPTKFRYRLQSCT